MCVDTFGKTKNSTYGITGPIPGRRDCPRAAYRAAGGQPLCCSGCQRLIISNNQGRITFQVPVSPDVLCVTLGLVLWLGLGLVILAGRANLDNNRSY